MKLPAILIAAGLVAGAFGPSAAMAQTVTRTTTTTVHHGYVRHPVHVRHRVCESHRPLLRGRTTRCYYR